MQVTSANSQASALQAATSNDIGRKDVFLKLLVAQMQNQDPLKPQDPTQMSSQLAQFNMVEQQINTNKLLTDISGGMQSKDSQAASAASYLGHKAVVNGNSLNYDGLTPQDLVIQTNQTAAVAKVQVLDSNGNVVKTLNNGPMNSGNSSFTWNGTTDAGTKAAAGKYTIATAATDAAGKSIVTNTQMIGQVQAVNLSVNGVQLVVNGTPVSMANIQEIRL